MKDKNYFNLLARLIEKEDLIIKKENTLYKIFSKRGDLISQFTSTNLDSKNSDNQNEYIGNICQIVEKFIEMQKVNDSKSLCEYLDRKAGIEWQ